MGFRQEQEKLIVGAIYKALKERRELLPYCRIAIIDSLIGSLNTLELSEAEYYIQKLRDDREHEQTKKGR